VAEAGSADSLDGAGFDLLGAAFRPCRAEGIAVGSSDLDLLVFVTGKLIGDSDCFVPA